METEEIQGDWWPLQGRGGWAVTPARPLGSPPPILAPLCKGLTEGSVCPVGTCPAGAKRPAGYQPKRAERPAGSSATIEVAGLSPKVTEGLYVCYTKANKRQLPHPCALLTAARAVLFRSARARGSGDPRTGPPDPLDSLPPSDAGDTPDPGGGISAPPKRGGRYNGITAQLPGAPGDAPSSSYPCRSSRQAK